MERNMPSYSHRDEKSKSSRSEDLGTGQRSKMETDRLRLQRRRAWAIQQEKERQHEKLKRKMIMDYEIRRAREKVLLSRRRCSHRSHSKSRSWSPESQHRRIDKASILSEKLEPSDGTTPLFKGPEGTQVSATELRRIKVDIHRNIPGKTTIGELQRDIVNPEDVMVKRRAGKILFLIIII